MNTVDSILDHLSRRWHPQHSFYPFLSPGQKRYVNRLLDTFERQSRFHFSQDQATATLLTGLVGVIKQDGLIPVVIHFNRRYHRKQRLQPLPVVGLFEGSFIAQAAIQPDCDSVERSLLQSISCRAAGHGPLIVPLHGIRLTIPSWEVYLAKDEFGNQPC